MSRAGGRAVVLAMYGAMAAISCGTSATEGARDGGAVDALRVDAGRVDAPTRDGAARDATGQHDARPSTPDGATRDATNDVAIDSNLDSGTRVDAKDGGTDTGAAHDAVADAETLCVQACNHLEACTGDTCSQVGITCPTTVSPCIQACLLATPCVDLDAGAVQSCEQQCADGGARDAGARDAVADGGSTEGCQACVDQVCQTQLTSCAQNTSSMCLGWLQCIEACISGSDPVSCYTGCDTQYASAEASYEPVYQCVCASCNADCPAANACTH
jgi:hypothetical protein